MTAQEAIIEVYETLGEPSDLPIYAAGGVFNIAAAGSIRILAALNRAQDYVATYKLPTTANGRPLYFRALEGRATFEFKSVAGDVATQTDTTLKSVALGTTLSASAANRFNLWIAKFEDESVRRVLRHTVVGGIGTLILDNPLDTALTGGEDITLFCPVYALGVGEDDIPVDDRIFEILRISDLTSGSDFEYTTTRLQTTGASLATPSAWSKLGNRVMFDAADDDAAHSYEVSYVRYPASAVDASDEFELPLAFHAAIVLWATRWGFQRMMESTNAYAIKKDFEDVMRTAQTQIDAEDFVGGDYLSPDLG